MKYYDIKVGIILLFLAFGCNSTPKGMLSEDKMAAIIADMKVLEVKADRFYLRNVDSTKVAFKYLQNKLLQKHNTDSAVYYKSYNYYIDHKKQMLQILDKAQNLIDTTAKNPKEKKLLLE